MGLLGGGAAVWTRPRAPSGTQRGVPVAERGRHECWGFWAQPAPSAHLPRPHLGSGPSVGGLPFSLLVFLERMTEGWRAVWGWGLRTLETEAQSLDQGWRGAWGGRDARRGCSWEGKQELARMLEVLVPCPSSG